MATQTSQQRKVESTINNIGVSISSAIKALDALDDRDIRNTSYGNGISLFSQLLKELNTAHSTCRKIMFFK